MIIIMIKTIITIIIGVAADRRGGPLRGSGA